MKATSCLGDHLLSTQLILLLDDSIVFVIVTVDLHFTHEPSGEACQDCRTQVP